MYLIITSGFCYAIAFVFICLPFLIPDPRMVLFTYLGILMVGVPNILVWQRIIASRMYQHVERQPKWKHLIDYIRRDNHVISIFGNRAYPGESFLDVPELGLIEFLGRDCYYNWGDKKILFGLENVNYSPDIRYSNLCHTLWELGFKNSDDVRNVLMGNDLLLMGKVYQNMKSYDESHGVKRLVKDLREYNGPKRTFLPPPSAKPVKKVLRVNTERDIHTSIDNILNRRN